MSITRFFSNVKYLCLEQILEVRSYWVLFAVFSLLLPLTMIFGLTRIGGQADDTALMVRVIVGTAIFWLANDGITILAVRVATMHRDGTLIYYASLPISKSSLITALILSRAFISLPGVVSPLVLAPILFHFSANLHPLLLFIIPLTMLLLSMAGMALGLLSRNVEFVTNATYVILYILAMATPLFLPIEALPAPLQWLSRLLPTTYATEALGILLNGAPNATFWIDAAVLMGMAVICVFVLERKLPWHVD